MVVVALGYTDISSWSPKQFRFNFTGGDPTAFFREDPASEMQIYRETTPCNPEP
jgi:hypothetical protein